MIPLVPCFILSFTVLLTSHVNIPQRDFFGLRDFYSLVKMIYQTACDIGATPGPEEIALCVQVGPNTWMFKTFCG